MSNATVGDTGFSTLAQDVATKKLYVKAFGIHTGWNGLEGSYFIEGVQAGLRESKDAIASEREHAQKLRETFLRMQQEHSSAIAERDARIAVLEKRIAELEKSA